VVRLGLVASIVLAVIVVTVGRREMSLNIISSAAPSSTQPGRITTTKTSLSTGPMSPKGAAAVSDAAAFKARTSIPPGNTADLVMAAKLMIPAPPGTDSKLKDVDPRTLRAIFQRGRTARQSNSDDATSADDARLINIAAILGYEPARALITMEYPRSFIRYNVSSAEAVRTF
jgi:hypothetical protein